jgi:hypothetical protein
MTRMYDGFEDHVLSLRTIDLASHAVLNRRNSKGFVEILSL